MKLNCTKNFKQQGLHHPVAELQSGRTQSSVPIQSSCSGKQQTEAGQWRGNDWASSPQTPVPSLSVLLRDLQPLNPQPEVFLFLSTDALPALPCLHPL